VYDRAALAFFKLDSALNVRFRPRAGRLLAGGRCVDRT
jgi:hypothetical protein